ncbi:MAG: energy transducer TonB [Cyclobacteriaceae bacterium]
MKKLIALTFTLAIVFASYAGDGKAEKPKATNYKEVLKEIVYPQASMEQGIEGKVIVELKINKSGEITNYKFKSFPCSDMKEVVESALTKMTFVPATNKKGQTVNGRITLPVNFQLTI